MLVRRCRSQLRHSRRLHGCSYCAPEITQANARRGLSSVRLKAGPIIVWNCCHDDLKVKMLTTAPWNIEQRTSSRRMQEMDKFWNQAVRVSGD
eukprot:766875-Hanusia_phi.AAC.3